MSQHCPFAQLPHTLRFCDEQQARRLRSPATSLQGPLSCPDTPARRKTSVASKAPTPQEVVLCLRIVPAPSSRKGHLAFSTRYFNANVFSQKEESKQMWAIWQGCSSFVSKCKRLVGRILNITLAIHKHFIFQERQGGKGCVQ